MSKSTSLETLNYEQRRQIDLLNEHIKKTVQDIVLLGTEDKDTLQVILEHKTYFNRGHFVLFGFKPDDDYSRKMDRECIARFVREERSYDGHQQKEVLITETVTEEGDGWNLKIEIENRGIVTDVSFNTSGKFLGVRLILESMLGTLISQKWNAFSNEEKVREMKDVESRYGGKQYYEMWTKKLD